MSVHDAVPRFLLSFGTLLHWGLPHLSLGDLPIHCTLQDVAADWTFYLAPAQPFNGRIPACGHSIPNAVKTMMAIKRDEILPTHDAEAFPVRLTEDIVTTPSRHLQAWHTGGGGITQGEAGNWTMVFDTGLEIRIGGRSLVAHFFFDKLPNAARQPANGDNWEHIGRYSGRDDVEIEPEGQTYACHCDLTSTGWWHRRTSAGNFEGGCMWGAKTESFGPDDLLLHSSAPTSVVRLHHPVADPESHLAVNGSEDPLKLSLQHAVLNTSDFGSRPALLREGSLVKEVFRLQEPASAASTKTSSKARSGSFLQRHGSKTHSKTSDGSDASDLPVSFDWRDELALMVPPGEDPLGVQIDQGPCGSCYAFAAVMMLQMRFRAQLFRQHGILYPLELSYKSAARCSPYTEGCSGGFSYFTGRVETEIGVPLAECDASLPATGVDSSCDWSCYTNNDMLFYARDYVNIGGFSHGSDEASIMREIYLHGPVELGFSTTAVPEFVALSGQSNYPNETDVMTVILNRKVKKEKYSTNAEIHRWWYSTHAILAVGWGEDDPHWGTVKYWTVRNSWGRGWGNGGYGKMRRGNNDGGIETDASSVYPDLTRLPLGFLEKAKEYHAKQEKVREHWAKQSSSTRGVEPTGGIPEYCEQRPDSPDCQFFLQTLR